MFWYGHIIFGASGVTASMLTVNLLTGMPHRHFNQKVIPGLHVLPTERRLWNLLASIRTSADFSGVRVYLGQSPLVTTPFLKRVVAVFEHRQWGKTLSRGEKEETYSPTAWNHCLSVLVAYPEQTVAMPEVVFAKLLAIGFSSVNFTNAVYILNRRLADPLLAKLTDKNIASLVKYSIPRIGAILDKIIQVAQQPALSLRPSTIIAMGVGRNWQESFARISQSESVGSDLIEIDSYLSSNPALARVLAMHFTLCPRKAKQVVSGQGSASREKWRAKLQLFLANEAEILSFQCESSMKKILRGSLPALQNAIRLARLRITDMGTYGFSDSQIAQLCEHSWAVLEPIIQFTSEAKGLLGRTNDKIIKAGLAADSAHQLELLRAELVEATMLTCPRDEVFIRYNKLSPKNKAVVFRLLHACLPPGNHWRLRELKRVFASPGYLEANLADLLFLLNLDEPEQAMQKKLIAIRKIRYAKHLPMEAVGRLSVEEALSVKRWLEARNDNSVAIPIGGKVKSSRAGWIVLTSIDRQNCHGIMVILKNLKPHAWYSLTFGSSSVESLVNLNHGGDSYKWVEAREENILNKRQFCITPCGVLYEVDNS